MKVSDMEFWWFFFTFVCTANFLFQILRKIENDVERVVGRKVKILRKTTGKHEERIAEGILRYLVDLTYSICAFAKFCPKALEFYHDAGLTAA